MDLHNPWGRDISNHWPVFVKMTETAYTIKNEEEEDEIASAEKHAYTIMNAHFDGLLTTVGSFKKLVRKVTSEIEALNESHNYDDGVRVVSMCNSVDNEFNIRLEVLNNCEGQWHSTQVAATGYIVKQAADESNIKAFLSTMSRWHIAKNAIQD